MTKLGLFAYGEMGEAVLSVLIDKFEIVWIYLPPEKKQTSNEKSTHRLAKKNNIPIFYTSNIKDIESNIEKNPPKVILVSSFNKILPENIINLSKFINIHLGDLPKMRGRANVNWAIIHDAKKIVITIHQITSKLDAGNIYAKYPISIKREDSVDIIYDKINKRLGLSIVPVINRIVKGYSGVSQKGAPTYYCTRLPEDGLINFSNSSREIFNLIRAVSKPYPGAFTYHGGEKLIVWSARIPKNPKKYVGRIEGRIVEIHKDGVEVLTKDSSIIIEKVNYKGKDRNCNDVIKSVKTTLGIDYINLYEKLIKNES